MSIKLKLERYRQEPSCCSIAAIAAVAHFYNKGWDYENVKGISESIIKSEVVEGLYTSEIASVLNAIGFKEVHIVSSNLEYLDCSWVDLSHKKIVDKLTKVLKSNNDSLDTTMIKQLIGFLSDERYHNRIVISHMFGDRIREYLQAGKPLILSFNWNKLFGFTKYNEKGKPDDINGECEDHAVVASGYDDDGVFIIDSHHEYYKYRLKTYRNGRYHVGWEELMSIMGGDGELIVPMNYSSDVSEYELK